MCYACEGWRTQEVWGWKEPCRVVITVAEKSWSILWVWCGLCMETKSECEHILLDAMGWMIKQGRISFLLMNKYTCFYQIS